MEYKMPTHIEMNRIFGIFTNKEEPCHSSTIAHSRLGNRRNNRKKPMKVIQIVKRVK